MIDRLHTLAAAAGIIRHWRDVDGNDHTVSDIVLCQVLASLGYPAETSQQIDASRAIIAAQAAQPPSMVVCDQGQPATLPLPDGPVELVAEDGSARVVDLVSGMLPPIDSPGYYRIAAHGFSGTLAIAPRRLGPTPGNAPAKRMWGPIVQIPSLRSAAGEAYGHLGLLADAARQFGARGADLLAISPVHALVPGDGDDFSPYSPSSRLFLNTALADPALLGLPPLEPGPAAALINWPAAIPARLAAQRALYAALAPDQRARIAAEVASEGPALVRHALFDALFLKLRSSGAREWQDWPEELRCPDSAAARKFAQENAEEIAFHGFLQWLARGSITAAQSAALGAGMGLGLIADLAVGVRPGGSDAWAMRGAMLDGLTIGAPPDALGPLGQNWGLTTYSPQGLASLGYAPWIDLLRASLRWSRGVRIDHAFGLARLWMIPAGGDPQDGAYLTYPFQDLIRLAVLEAHRAGAIILAEDLGTAPPGFDAAIAERGVLGMGVLWFQRAADHGFISAHDYAPASAAMTGTHDTTTVGGWWKGTDLDWADRLGRLPADVSLAKAQEIRDWDRGLLWSTIGDGQPRPAPDDPHRVIDAAIEHVARTPAQLVAVPLEDLAGLDQQVNIPGTTREHPNWTRRMPGVTAALLDQDDLQRRIDLLNRRVSADHQGVTCA